MRFGAFSFGSIEIDDVTYDHDVVIDRGEIRRRKKQPSKQFRDEHGHTPLSVEEEIPWKCRRLGPPWRLDAFTAVGEGRWRPGEPARRAARALERCDASRQ